MAWFKKKKKKNEIMVVGAKEVEKVLEMMAAPEEFPCPEIMLATHTCYCYGCSRIGTCSIERMSRSVGCAKSFSTYCSLRDSLKDSPTCGWAEIIMKNIASDDAAKYGYGMVQRITGIKPTKEQKDGEKSDGKKKASTGTHITSGFNGPDISTA